MDASDTHTNRGLAIRAPLIGLLLAAFVALWTEYAANRLGVEAAATHLPPALLLPFLLFILLPNTLLQHIAPKQALRRSELILIFIMGLIASIVPDQAMTKYLLVVITSPHYFAGPENRWAELFFSYLPDWLVLQNQGEAVRLFFEGVPVGQAIPWTAWITPLFWWGSLIGALMFAGTCIVTILRRQWMVYERLRYPIGEAALHLIEAGTGPSDTERPGIRRSPLFRVGFVLTAGIMAWNILSFWGIWPPVPIMATDSVSIRIDPAFSPLTLRMNVFVFCFLFFVNTEILFSLWVFLLLYNVQEGFLNTFGVSSVSGSIVDGGLVGIQSIGGLIAFVLRGLWMSRRHLADVWRKACGFPSDLDDRTELLSYRTAVFGLILCLGYMVCWLYAAGLSISIIALFLFLLFVFYLALARVTAEAGLVSVDLPINAHQFTVGIIGSAHMAPGDLTTLGLGNAFARNWRTFTMVAPTHAAWFGQWTGEHRLFRCCAAAFAVATAVSIGYVIQAAYTYGAQNLHTDIGTDRGLRFYGLITQWIDNATQITELDTLFLISGMGGMAVLTGARYIFSWWPLHPIGMVVVMSAPVKNALLPLFLAWLIQTILLRIGGGVLYRKVQPLFIGILIAYLFGQAIAMVIDLAFFPDRPHQWEVY